MPANLWTWITDLPLTNAEASEAQACARSRWKIENETFNTLKNQGYKLEHHFGHGDEHLATVLMLLMLPLAFLIDTVAGTVLSAVPSRADQSPDGPVTGSGNECVCCYTNCNSAAGATCICGSSHRRS